MLIFTDGMELVDANDLTDRWNEGDNKHEPGEMFCICKPEHQQYFQLSGNIAFVDDLGDETEN